MGKLVSCSVCWTLTDIKKAPIIEGKRVCGECKRKLKEEGKI